MNVTKEEASVAVDAMMTGTLLARYGVKTNNKDIFILGSEVSLRNYTLVSRYINAHPEAKEFEIIKKLHNPYAMFIIPYTEEEDARHLKWLDEFVDGASQNEHDGQVAMRGAVECFINRMREEYIKQGGTIEYKTSR